MPFCDRLNAVLWPIHGRSLADSEPFRLAWDGRISLSLYYQIMPPLPSHYRTATVMDYTVGGYGGRIVRTVLIASNSRLAPRLLVLDGIFHLKPGSPHTIM